VRARSAAFPLNDDPLPSAPGQTRFGVPNRLLSFFCLPSFCLLPGFLAEKWGPENEGFDRSQRRGLGGRARAAGSARRARITFSSWASNFMHSLAAKRHKRLKTGTRHEDKRWRQRPFSTANGREATRMGNGVGILTNRPAAVLVDAGVYLAH